MDLSRLKEHAISLKGGEPTKITEPCLSCGERCCNRFAVTLTCFDILRIMKHLNVQPSAFCMLDDAKYTEQALHSSIKIHGKEEPQILVLKRFKTNYCAFSLHSNGCAIWGQHPYVCRAYPFMLDKKQGFKLNKNFVCPRKWRAGEYVPDEVLKILRHQDKEVIAHNKIIASWNANHAKEGGEREFWEYLLAESNKGTARNSPSSNSMP